MRGCARWLSWSVGALMCGTAHAGVSGWLSELWGDPPPGAVSGVERAWLLRLDDGRVLRVDGDPAMLHDLSGGRVALDGSTSRARLQVAAARRLPAAKSDTTMTGAKPWIAVLCKFADVPAEQQAPAFFDRMLSASPGGLDHFWRELSSGQMNLHGSTHTRWYTLPQGRAFYVHDLDGNGTEDVEFEALRRDCMGAADADVHFPDFYGVGLVLNASIGCCAWGSTTLIDVDGEVARPFGITWLPDWSWQQQTALAHETGHGFGLAHSRGAGITYNNPWDVMSSIWVRCEQAQDPVLGCLGYHTLAMNKNKLGWIGQERRFVAGPGTRTALRFERLERPTLADGLLIARIPIRGSPTRWYSVEARRRVGYDLRLRGNGIVIHEIDDLEGEPANVVDDGQDLIPDDDGTRWTPGEAFVDAANGIRVEVGAADRSGFAVTIERASDLIFGDGFEGADLSAWSAHAGSVAPGTAAALRGARGLAVTLGSNAPAFVEDASPAHEPRYRARLRFDPNSIVMSPGDRHLILAAYGDGAAPLAWLELQRRTHGYRLRALARTDTGAVRATPAVPLGDAAHDLEIDWRAAERPWIPNGALALSIDGAAAGSLIELDNSTQAIERVRLGAVSGIDAGTRGSEWFDAFESREELSPGPS